MVSRGLNIFSWNFHATYKYKVKIFINRNYLKQYKSKLKLIIKNSYNKKLVNIVKDINAEIVTWFRLHSFVNDLKVLCFELDLYVNKILWRFLKRYYSRRTNNWIFSRFWKKFSGIWKFYVLDDTSYNKVIFLKSHFSILSKTHFFSRGFNAFNSFNKYKLYKVLFNRNIMNFKGSHKILFLEQKGLCYICRRPLFATNFSILKNYSKLYKTNLLSNLLLIHSYCKTLKL